MGEFGLATAVVLLLLGASWGLHQAAPWNLILAGGALIITAFGISLVAGLGYHLALYRTLGPARLPPRWWLNPTALHACLQDAESGRVLPWFYVGAAGVGVVFAACAAVMVGLWRLRQAP